MWPARLIGSKEPVIFRLKLCDAGETCMSRFNHILPVSLMLDLHQRVLCSVYTGESYDRFMVVSLMLGLYRRVLSLVYSGKPCARFIPASLMLN